MDFVKFAEACGARGIRIDDPARCGEQLAQALSWDGPAIIECVTEEHEPPYPAKVNRDQVSKLMAALREGTPNRRRIALQMVRDLLDESSFDASPAHAVPGPVGRAAAKIAGRLQGTDRSEP
jgi:pyruvate dehydrogenase (quinone)/pyruvate oxidase